MELDHASVGKRVGAWFIDVILMILLAALFLFVASAYVDFTEFAAEMEPYYEKYETMYNTSFSISQEEYETLSEQDRKNYEDAYRAMTADPEANEAYAAVILKYLGAVSIALFAAFFILEFLLPLLHKRGQTLGKMACSIALTRPNAVRLHPFQQFMRAIPGKFVLTIFLPLYLAVMSFFGFFGTVGLIILAALALGQLILMSVTPNHSAIHDFMGGSVAVDQNFQRIFDNQAELEEYLSSQNQ